MRIVALAALAASLAACASGKTEGAAEAKSMEQIYSRGAAVSASGR
jgi:hypothetical protein